MQKRVIQFLNRYNILYQKHFGFQKNFSTVHAIIELIEKSFEKKKSVCTVFIDLKKAFDTVDHNILELTIFSYGIRDTPNNWFSSYLTNRNQFVTINSFYFDLQYAGPRVP